MGWYVWEMNHNNSPEKYWGWVWSAVGDLDEVVDEAAMRLKVY